MKLTRGMAISLIYVLVGFALLMAVFAYLSRDNLFRFLLDPRVPYQTYVPPKALDYSKPESWALPPPTDQSKSAANVFVVMPTTYWGGKDWNTNPDNKQANARLMRVDVPNWAGPFRAAGYVSSPKYRAASLYSFLTIRHDARYARKLAYGDVLHAFDQWYKQIDGKGPIVLVGVEQGGLDVLGLLQDRFADNPWYRERLAAAYVIDFAVPKDMLENSLSTIPLCHTPTSTHCLITYGAFTEKNTKEINRFRNRSMVWDENGRLQLTAGKVLSCVNPVLGSDSHDFAPARLHKGGAAATDLEWGVDPAPIPGQTSTQCVDGILIIDKPGSSSLRRKRSLGARFKPADFNLFYVDLSEDAKRRVDSLRTEFKEKGRLAPPFGESISLKESPINKVPDK